MTTRLIASASWGVALRITHAPAAVFERSLKLSCLLGSLRRSRHVLLSDTASIPAEPLPCRRASAERRYSVPKAGRRPRTAPGALGAGLSYRAHRHSRAARRERPRNTPRP